MESSTFSQQQPPRPPSSTGKAAGRGGAAAAAGRRMSMTPLEGVAPAAAPPPASAYDMSLGAWQGKWSTDIGAIISISSFAIARYFREGHRIDIVECKNLEAASSSGGGGNNNNNALGSMGGLNSSSSSSSSSGGGGGANSMDFANADPAEAAFMAEAGSLYVHVAEVGSVSLSACGLASHQQLLSMHTFTIEDNTAAAAHVSDGGSDGNNVNNKGYFDTCPQILPRGTYILCLLKDDSSHYIVLNVTPTNKLAYLGKGRIGEGKDFYSNLVLGEGEARTTTDPQTDNYFQPTHFTVFGYPSPHYGLAYDADSGAYAVVSLVSLVLRAVVGLRQLYPTAYLPPDVAAAVDAYSSLLRSSSNNPQQQRGGGGGKGSCLPFDAQGTNVMTAVLIQRGLFEAEWTDIMWKGSPHRYSTRQKFYCYNAVSGACAFESLRVDRRYVLLAEGEEVSFPMAGDKAQLSQSDTDNGIAAAAAAMALRGGSSSTTSGASPSLSSTQNTLHAAATTEDDNGTRTPTPTPTAGESGDEEATNNTQSKGGKKSVTLPLAPANNNNNSPPPSSSSSLYARMAAHRRSIALVGTESQPARRKGCLLIPLNLNKQVGCLLYSHNYLSVPSSGRSTGVVPRIGHSRRRRDGGGNNGGGSSKSSTVSFDHATAMLQKRIFAHDEPWTTCVFLTNASHNHNVASSASAPPSAAAGGGGVSSSSINNTTNSNARSFLLSYSQASGTVWISQIYQIAKSQKKAGADVALPSLFSSMTSSSAGNASSPYRWGGGGGSGVALGGSSASTTLPSLAATNGHRTTTTTTTSNNNMAAAPPSSSYLAGRRGSSPLHHHGNSPNSPLLVLSSTPPNNNGNVGLGSANGNNNSGSGDHYRPGSGKARLEEWRRSPTNARSGRDVHLYDEAADALGTPFSVVTRYSDAKPGSVGGFEESSHNPFLNTSVGGGGTTALNKNVQLRRRSTMPAGAAVSESNTNGGDVPDDEDDDDGADGDQLPQARDNEDDELRTGEPLENPSETASENESNGDPEAQGDGNGDGLGDSKKGNKKKRTTNAASSTADENEAVAVDDEPVADSSTTNTKEEGGTQGGADRPAPKSQDAGNKNGSAAAEDDDKTQEKEGEVEEDVDDDPSRPRPVKLSLAEILAAAHRGDTKGFSVFTDSDDVAQMLSQRGKRSRGGGGPNRRESSLDDEGDGRSADGGVASPALSTRKSKARVPKPPPSDQHHRPSTTGGGSVRGGVAERKGRGRLPSASARNSSSNTNNGFLSPSSSSLPPSPNARGRTASHSGFYTPEQYIDRRRSSAYRGGAGVGGGVGDTATSGGGSSQRPNTAQYNATKPKGPHFHTGYRADRSNNHFYHNHQHENDSGLPSYASPRQRTHPSHSSSDPNYDEHGRRLKSPTMTEEERDAAAEQRQKMYNYKIPERPKSSRKKPTQFEVEDAADDDDDENEEEGGEGEEGSKKRRRFHRKLKSSTPRFISPARSRNADGGGESSGGEDDDDKAKEGAGDDAMNTTIPTTFKGASRPMFAKGVTASSLSSPTSKRLHGYPPTTDDFHADITAIIEHMRQCGAVPACFDDAVELALSKVDDMEEGDDDGGLMERPEYKYAGVVIATPWKMVPPTRNPTQSLASAPDKHSELAKFERKFAKKREKEAETLIFTKKKMELLHNPLHKREEFQQQQIKKMLAQHQKIQRVTKVPDPTGKPDPPVNVKAQIERLAEADIRIRQANLENKTKQREKERMREVKEPKKLDAKAHEEHVTRMYEEAQRIHQQTLEKLIRQRDAKEKKEVYGCERKNLTKEEVKKLGERLIDESIKRREAERAEILRDMDKRVLEHQVALRDAEGHSVKLSPEDVASIAARLSTNGKA